jgi:hypothetical protein
MSEKSSLWNDRGRIKNMILDNMRNGTPRVSLNALLDARHRAEKQKDQNQILKYGAIIRCLQEMLADSTLRMEGDYVSIRMKRPTVRRVEDE